MVFVPSAPLLVPQLAGPAAAETDPVRDATRAAGEHLAGVARRWVAVGAADPGRDPVRPEAYARGGDFGAYGVAVAVDLGPADVAGTHRLPLSMLIAGWLRGESGADAVDPHVIAADTTPQTCATIGRALAADLAAVAADEPIGILVVGDGSFALSAKSPGGGRDPSAVAVQEQIDTALTTGDVAALAALDPAACAAAGVGGRAAWQVAAGLCAGLIHAGRRPDACSVDVTARYVGAPFGVGYVVAEWTVTDVDG